MGVVAPAAPSHVAEPQLNSFAVILAVILLLQLSSVFLVANPSCLRQGPLPKTSPHFSPRAPAALGWQRGFVPSPPFALIGGEMVVGEKNKKVLTINLIL